MGRFFWSPLTEGVGEEKKKENKFQTTLISASKQNWKQILKKPKKFGVGVFFPSPPFPFSPISSPLPCGGGLFSLPAEPGIRSSKLLVFHGDPSPPALLRGGWAGSPSPFLPLNPLLPSPAPACGSGGFIVPLRAVGAASCARAQPAPAAPIRAPRRAGAERRCSARRGRGRARGAAPSRCGAGGAALRAQG